MTTSLILLDYILRAAVPEAIDTGRLLGDDDGMFEQAGAVAVRGLTESAAQHGRRRKMGASDSDYHAKGGVIPHNK